MIYELGYLVLPTFPEEQVAPEVSKLKEILEKYEAKVISDEYPVLIELAYTMVKRLDNKNQRFDTGYFGWIKFEVSAEVMDQIKKDLDRNFSLLRFMITRTVRENTVAAKKILSSNIITRSSRAPKAKVEEVGKMDSDKVDSEIDKLIVDVPQAEDAEEKKEEAPVETEVKEEETPAESDAKETKDEE